MTMAEAMERARKMAEELDGVAQEFAGVPGEDDMQKNAQALRLLMQSTEDEKPCAQT